MAEFDPIEERAQGTDYDPIIPKINDWPIARMYSNRQDLVDEVIDFTMESISQRYTKNDQLEKQISAAHYNEFKRMRDQPWKVDKKDEGDFWRGIKAASTAIKIDDETAREDYLQIIRNIVERYTNEISGNFYPRSYHFAKRFLSFGFASLLNAFQAKNIKAVFDHKIFIQDRIKITGHVDHIRELGKKGTIVLLPTHFSNLDSIIIAWSIHAIGLPAMIYGAGLNLFNSRLVGYFMNRLGAYKLDRRKKNLIYLMTLKAFSTRTMMRGAHTLFFPGGTRSRDGSLEKQLKLGLLGTCFEAQRLNLSEGKENGKIFYVPLVMSYNFVLEARSLINQYLKKSEEEKYYYFKKDEFRSRRKVSKFVFELLKNKSDIYLSFGQPKDLFGNPVDKEGNSLDQSGNTIDIADYFKEGSQLKEDSQRDNVYTKQLGERLLDDFKITNKVLSSHLVCLVAFEMLLRKFDVKEFFGLKEIDRKDLFLSYSEFKDEVQNVLQAILHLHEEGGVQISNTLKDDIDTIIATGIKYAGIVHEKKVLKKKSDTVSTESIELLYYYRNRLMGYGFEEHIGQ